jgi:hypothetical protein
MIDSIVQNFPDAFQEFDSRLPEVVGGFFRGAPGAEKSSDSFAGVAAEAMGVIVSVGMGALFFH